MVSFLEKAFFDGLTLVFFGNDSLTRTTISSWGWGIGLQKKNATQKAQALPAPWAADMVCCEIQSPIVKRQALAKGARNVLHHMHRAWYAVRYFPNRSGSIHPRWILPRKYYAICIDRVSTDPTNIKSQTRRSVPSEAKRWPMQCTESALFRNQMMVLSPGFYTIFLRWNDRKALLIMAQQSRILAYL